jgi:hypothetical protein
MASRSLSPMTPSNKSLDRSHGGDFRIKRDPAKLLGSAVARSTQAFDIIL